MFVRPEARAPASANRYFFLSPGFGGIGLAGVFGVVGVVVGCLGLEVGFGFIGPVEACSFMSVWLRR